MKNWSAVAVFGAMVMSSASVLADEWELTSEVLARVGVSADVRARVDEIRTRHEPTIQALKKKEDEASAKAFDVLLGDSSAEERDAAKRRWDQAREDSHAAVASRDADIRAALPADLAGKYDIGMQLVTERENKSSEVFGEYMKAAMDGALTDETKKRLLDKDKEIRVEYNRRLDAQVGPLPRKAPAASP